MWVSDETWQPLPQEWYAGAVLEVARRLLGKVVAHRTPEGLTAGVIGGGGGDGGAGGPAPPAHAGEKGRNGGQFVAARPADVSFSHWVQCLLDPSSGVH